MKQLQVFKKVEKPDCKYFIAAKVFESSNRIEFGIGWNDYRRIHLIGRVYSISLNSVLSSVIPFTFRYSNNGASVHDNPYKAMRGMVAYDEGGEKLMLIGAKDIDIQEGIQVIKYGSETEILQHLSNLEYPKI